MPGFVNWVSGQILSAADIMRLAQHNYVVKASDTARSSTTTLAADPHLTLAVAVNTDYVLDGIVIYSGTNPNGGITYGWTGPTGATMSWNSGGSTVYDAQGTPNVDTAALPISSFAVGVGLGTGGASNPFLISARPYGLLRVAGTAGNLVLRWAQAASNADATVVRAGSWLRITKIS